MNISPRILLAGIFGLIISSAIAAKKSHSKPHPGAADTEAATRLQVFLDRANFGPGKLDGHYGDFTRKALSLYRQAHGESTESPASSAGKKETPPDVTGLDLASVEPVFITYTVTDADLQNVGPVPESVPEQAKLKALPYREASEAIAEKFHCDRDFLEQLNPGKTKTIKVGDQFKVPNVEPFELSTIKDVRPGSELPPSAANEMSDEPDMATPKPDGAQNNSADASPETTVNIDTRTNFLTVLEGNKIIAAYPVTIGSGETESPLGEWKVRGIAKLPTFRYDEKMLQHGERSSHFHLLPPGPNNPVGVIWIALNKKGIGLHGTAEPDEIGRSASHGCIRLANWDIVRLATRVRAGVPVSIH